MILVAEYTPGPGLLGADRAVWQAMAEQIAAMDGLRWKYWLRSIEGGRYGGVYLFATGDHAKAAWHRLRDSLADAGASDITLRLFEVDAELSAVTGGMVP